MRKQALIILLCVCMCMSVCAFADTHDFVNDNGNWADIRDNAGLFTDEPALLHVMEYVTEHTNALCYTTDSNSRSTKALAQSLSEEAFGDDNGVLFLIDMDNRYVYIYAHNDTYSVINSTIAETITDNVYNYASREDYDGCASEAFAQIYHKLSGKRIPEPMRYIGNIFLAIMLGIGITAIWACYTSRIQVTSFSPKDVQVHLRDKRRDTIKVTRTYRSSSSGGGSSGGSGGGGGGGGHSGGGGGHRF